MTTALDNLKQLIDDEKWDQIQQLMTSHKESFCNYISDARMVSRLVERFGWDKFLMMINNTTQNGTNNLIRILSLITPSTLFNSSNGDEQRALIQHLDTNNLQEMISNYSQLISVLNCIHPQVLGDFFNKLGDEYVKRLTYGLTKWSHIFLTFNPDEETSKRFDTHVKMLETVEKDLNQLIQPQQRQLSREYQQKISALVTLHKDWLAHVICDPKIAKHLIDTIGWTTFCRIINDYNDLLYFLLLIPKEKYDYTTNHTELLRGIAPQKLQDIIKNDKQLYNALGCLTLDEGVSLGDCLGEEYIIKLLDDPQKWNEILNPGGNLKSRNKMIHFILNYVGQLVQTNERFCVLLKQMTIDEVKACIELVEKEHCQNLIKNGDELVNVLSLLNGFKPRTEMNDPLGLRLLTDMSFHERLSIVKAQQQLLEKLDHDQYLGTLFESIDQLELILTTLNYDYNLPDSSILNYASGGGPSQIQMKNQSIIIGAIGSRLDMLFKEHQQLLDVLKVLHPDCRIKLIEQLDASMYRLASSDEEKKAILDTLNLSDRLKIAQKWSPLSDLKKSLSVNLIEKDYGKARDDLQRIIDIHGNGGFTDCLPELMTLSQPERQQLFENKNAGSILFAIMSRFISSNEEIKTNLDFLIESGIRLSEEDVANLWSSLSLIHHNIKQGDNKIDHIFNKIKTLPPIVTTELLSRPAGCLNANPFERILCCLICSRNEKDRQLFENLYDEKKSCKKIWKQSNIESYMKNILMLADIQIQQRDGSPDNKKAIHLDSHGLSFVTNMYFITGDKRKKVKYALNLNEKIAQAKIALFQEKDLNTGIKVFQDKCSAAIEEAHTQSMFYRSWPEFFAKMAVFALTFGVVSLKTDFEKNLDSIRGEAHRLPELAKDCISNNQVKMVSTHEMLEQKMRNDSHISSATKQAHSGVKEDILDNHHDDLPQKKLKDETKKNQSMQSDSEDEDLFYDAQSGDELTDENKRPLSP